MLSLARLAASYAWLRRLEADVVGFEAEDARLYYTAPKWGVSLPAEGVRRAPDQQRPANASLFWPTYGSFLSLEDRFFSDPILNSPYEYPGEHWELDASGQPTQKIAAGRRKASFITPIPKPKKRRSLDGQAAFVFDEGIGLSTERQQYDPTSIINQIRTHVDEWRLRPNTGDWHVTPETARLLQHWRHHNFGGVRPFFCQVEAIEALIWLTEVAPHEARAKALLENLANVNASANSDLIRLALKLATGAGKTTVMAMIIAWQTVNAVRRPQSKRYTRGFLVVAPGITIKDRLRVLQANDPESYLLAI